jgi:isoprenylcysteine carboxyl methyltransferase (ICMT) family protein YpbQ
MSEDKTVKKKGSALDGNVSGVIMAIVFVAIFLFCTVKVSISAHRKILGIENLQTDVENIKKRVTILEENNER